MLVKRKSINYTIIANTKDTSRMVSDKSRKKALPSGQGEVFNQEKTDFQVEEGKVLNQSLQIKRPKK